MRARIGALACALLAAAPALASGLVDNVEGMAVEEDGRVVRFNGLLLDAQGRVEKRLTAKDKRPKQVDYRLDGRGRTLIPGFVDAHVQMMPLAVAQLSLDLSDTTSAVDVAERVRGYMAANPGRRWILGVGWDDAGWPAGETVSTAVLDAVSADLPVWLVDADGRRGWANGAALRLAGIAGTKGALDGADFARMAAVIPAPAPKDLDLAFLRAQRLLLGRGVTAVGDIGTDIAAWQTYRRAGDRDALRLRIVGYGRSIEDLAITAGPAPTPWLYEGRLRLAGLALEVGNGLGETALRNRMSRAAMDGFANALVVRNGAGIDDAAAAIAELKPSYGASGGWRIDLTVPTSGMASPAGVDLVSRDAGAGAVMGRPPFAPLAPLELLGRRPDALRGLTIAGARALGGQARFGSLAPGQYADFLLLDGTLDSLSPDQRAQVRIAEIWIGGRRVDLGDTPAAAQRPTDAQRNDKGTTGR